MEKTEADLWAWYRDGMHRELYDLEKRRRVIQARATAWGLAALGIVLIAYLLPVLLQPPRPVFVPLGFVLVLASLFKRDSTVEFVLTGFAILFWSLWPQGLIDVWLERDDPMLHRFLPRGTIFPALMVAAAGYFDVHHRMQTFTADFKGRVMRALVAFIDESWNFTPNAGVSRADFSDSGLFSEVKMETSGEDLVTGTVGEAPFSMSEFRAMQIHTYRDRMGVQRRRKTMLFAGLFFVTTYNRHFPHELIVVPDLAEKLLGYVGTRLQSLNPMRGELIKLEDPVFEKYFAVYGNDQVAARTVLQPAIMEEMVRFREKTGAGVRMSVRQGRFFAAVPLGRDIFEPPLFREITRFSELRTYYDDLTLFLDLARAIDQSTKRWNVTSALSEME